MPYNGKQQELCVDVCVVKVEGHEKYFRFSNGISHLVLPSDSIACHQKLMELLITGWLSCTFSIFFLH